MSAHTLVCIGGGHANLQLIAASRPLSRSSRRILISAGSVAVYSGMLPAAVAGLIDASEANVDLPRLCAKHGWEFLNARVTSIRSSSQTLTAVPRQSSSAPFDLGYTALSIDIGSTSTPLATLPPVQASSPDAVVPATIVATRPIGMLLPRLRRFELSRATLRGGESASLLHVCVVGAGKAGVELALALESRFRRTIPTATGISVTLVGGERDFEKPLGAAARVATAVLHERGIKLILGKKAMGVRGNAVLLEGSVSVEADLVMVATGAASHGWIKSDTDLGTDAAGFIVVESTLQAAGIPNVFAAGDCASMVGYNLPKAGVYAVRQGPILEKNLRAVLALSPGQAAKAVLQPYEPQALALALLSLGDESRRAIGSKGRLVVVGHWVYNLKMYIDRRWQSQFQTRPLAKNSTDSASVEEFSSNEDDVFQGSAKEGAALLFGPEASSSEEFAEQYSVLVRMDADPVFAEGVHDTCSY